MTPGVSERGPAAWTIWAWVGLMVTLWSMNPAIGKIALEELPPLLLIAVRTSIAAVAVSIAYILWPGVRRKVAAEDWPKLLLLGPVLQVGNQVAFIQGLSYTTVAHSAFIFSLVPILVLLMAASRGQEGISGLKLVGMAISISGVVLLTRDRGLGEPTLLGDGLTMVAVAMFSTFTVLGKQMRRRYGPVLINLVAYVGAGLAFQPLIWGWYGPAGYVGLSWRAWGALLYMAILSAVAGYLIYYWALRYVEASRLAAVQYLQPPLATAFGILMLGESVSAALLLAGAVILSGVVITERAPQRAVKDATIGGR